VRRSIAQALTRVKALLTVLSVCIAVAAPMLVAPPVAFAASFVVNTTMDTVDATPGNGICADAGGLCSLRAAIMETNALAGADTIILPAGTYTLTRAGINENDSATGDLDIKDALTITGSGGNQDGDPALTVIQAGASMATGIDKVITVNPYWSTPFATAIKAVTIRHGRNISPRGGDGYGVGLDWEGSHTGTLLVYNCIISDNWVQDGDGGGLVVTNDGATGPGALATIQRTVITNNQTPSGVGAGIFVGTNTPIQISDSTISNNTTGTTASSTGQGAGIYYFSTNLATASFITNSTLSGNTAVGSGADGGAVYAGRPLTISNSTLHSNQSGRDGGALLVSLSETGDSMSLTNVTISGNTAAGDGGGYVQSSGGDAAVTFTNVTVTNNRVGTGFNGGGLHSRTNGVNTVVLKNTIVAQNYEGAGSAADDVSGGVHSSSSYNVIGTGGSGGLTHGVNNNQVSVDARLAALASNGGSVKTHALLVGSPALDAGTATGAPVTDARGTGFARALDAADSDTTDEVDVGAHEAHPSIDDISDRSMLQDTIDSVTFNVGDADLSIDSVTATSSNTTLLPNNPANLAFSGSGASRTLTLQPAAGQYGTTTVTVTVSDVHNGTTQTMSDTFLLTVVPRPNLTVTKTHAGNLRQGQTGATYSLAVQNLGPGATVPAQGVVTVTDTLPTGLTATAMAGTGWTCNVGTLTCTRNDVLAASASYPPITITVNVAADTAPNITNTATVSGGGDNTSGNNTDGDPTTVIQVADLTVTKTHTGDFEQAQNGATYTLTVNNVGPGPTDAPVTVTDTLPAGLTATALSGSGWSCTLGTLTCTRSDALAIASSYPPITLTVNVARNANASVTNTAAVSGGGELNTANNSSSDATTVLPKPDLTVTKSHTGDFRQGQSGTYSITVANSGFAPTSGVVTMTDTLPAGLTATGLSGTGWTCDLPTLTCTRSDALATSSSYPVITLAVNVAGNAAAALTNNVAVSGGGENYTANNTASDTTTVILSPDLTVAKTHSGNFTQGQTGATYTITVSNAVGAGPTDGTTVTVTDTLPAGLTATAMTGTGWACTVGTLTCTRSDALAAGSSYPAITLTVNVAANAAPAVTNSVTVAGGGQVNTANDSASDTTNVNQLPDLILTKSHTGDFAQGLTGAQYTIAVSNSGTGVTSGTVTVADTLPAGLTATAITGTGWSCTLGSLQCTRSDALAAGASYPAITLTVNVANNAPASVTNTVAVSGGNDVNNANNTASDPTTVIQAADMTVAKSHTGSFRQGQTGSYTITVTNSGTAASSGTVTVTDTLPAGLAATAMAGTGWACDLPTLTCTRSDALAIGASYEAITLTVDVANNAAASVTNTATVSGGGEVITGNNTASDVTSVDQAADLTLTKSHTGNFVQGQTGAVFTITISNAGSGPTIGTVTMTDTLPAGLTATAMTGTGWTCTVGTLTCTRSDALAAGASYPAITLTVDVAVTAPPTLTNTATVAGGGELNTANDSASDTVNVNQLPDLTIAKTHSGDFAQGQTGATYTVTVTNSGSGLTSGTVSVTELPPAGLTVTALAGTDWTCNVGTLTCTRADELAAGNSYPAITVTVNVSLSTAPTVTNTVTVSGGNDTNGGNNTAGDPTTVVQVADMAVTKSHLGDFRQGQVGASYTLTVSNVGPGPTDGTAVTVTDTLPAGLTATAVTGTGWTCDLPTLTCSRSDVAGPGTSYSPINITVDVAANAAAALTNTAAVSGGGELNTANNTASDATTVVQVADLTVAKSHTGDFTQGQTGALYTLTVNNAGPGPTDAQVTVTDSLPAAFTATAMAGTGWTCDLPTLTCTRSDALAAGTSYPSITVTVDVGTTAAAAQTNAAAVSGGGEINTANNTASDPTTVIQLADLTLTKSHNGNMVKGHSGTYKLTVTNAGNAGTDGTAVTVTETLPTGMTATAISGTGWTCDLPTVVCTRSDVLAASASFPVITLEVAVADTATGILTNAAAVAGGGQVHLANDTASDPTNIVPPTAPGPPPWVRIKQLLKKLLRDAVVTITGEGTPNAVIIVNGAQVRVDGNGTWETLIELREGANVITASYAGLSDSITLVRDSIPPALQFTASASETEADSVWLKATTEDNAEIQIEGQTALELQVLLKPGNNHFTATATDEAGNVTKDTITVKRVPKKAVAYDVRPDEHSKIVTDEVTLEFPPGVAPKALKIKVEVLLEGEALDMARKGASLVTVVAVTAVEADTDKPVHQFNGQFTLRLFFDPAKVKDPSKLRIFYFDEQSKAWVQAGVTVLAVEGNEVVCRVDHLTMFALMAPSAAPPVMDSLPAKVSQPALAVSGQATAGEQIVLVVNGTVQATAAVGGDGRFTVNATLAEGSNRIYVKGAVELASNEAVVLYQSPPPPKAPFIDVEGHWALASVVHMVDLGVVRGYEDDTFRPEGRVTRLEFAVMVARLLKLSPSSDPLQFTDAAQVPDWARGQVSAAVTSGIIQGRANGSFDPAALVTRGEMAIMLVRAMRATGMTVSPGSASFSDAAQIPAWALDSVLAATAHGLINGYPDGTFRANDTATRAEAVTMLSRLQSVLPAGQ